MLWFYLYPNLTWFWLLLIGALVYLSWMDIRKTDLRPIVQFWWLLLVLILWVPGWVAMKAFLLYRARRTA